MSDATQKDLEQDRLLKKVREEFRESLEQIATDLDEKTAGALLLIDARLTAIEDQLIDEGRIRSANLLP